MGPESACAGCDRLLPPKTALGIQHDLWCIQNGALWLDMEILMMTPFVMMHRNAY
jgi:lipopolysaccharide/colanic/teichoic acid biosynthesis glycosyltransferase